MTQQSDNLDNCILSIPIEPEDGSRTTYLSGITNDSFCDDLSQDSGYKNHEKLKESNLKALIEKALADTLAKYAQNANVTIVVQDEGKGLTINKDTQNKGHNLISTESQTDESFVHSKKNTHVTNTIITPHGHTRHHRQENGGQTTGPIESIETSLDKNKQPHITIRYAKKMAGGHPRPPFESPLEALQSWIVSFTGMLVLTAIDYFLLDRTDYTLVIGSFGATAVLIFCAIKSPLSQPRNVIGGHLIAAVIGVTCQIILGKQYPWIAAPLAVSVSIAVMSLTNIVHPPAGATALIAVYSEDTIHRLGFMYVLIPVLAGATILLVVAVVMNNVFPSRRYPLHWI